MNKRKTIQLTFSINTDQNILQLTEGVAKIFENSVLSMPEFHLEVSEVKLIKETEYEN